MAEAADRPKVIDDFIDATKTKKLCEKLCEKLRPKVIELLKLGSFPGITHRADASEKALEEPFMVWLRQAVDKETADRMYVKVFDANMVKVLVMEGHFKMEDVPAKCINKKVTDVVTVTEKD